MIYFGKYLKDYLEYNNISQTEFATRIGITQKHMNEIINGKTRITLEMAGNIERLTGIKSEFIINVENSRILKENILKQYGNIDNLKKEITIKYHIDEIKKRSVKYKRWRTTKRQRHSDGSKFPLLYLCLFLFCVL